MSELIESKKIGDLNGRWSILFRGLMTVCGIMLPFTIWFGSWTTQMLFSIKEDIAVMSVKNEIDNESIKELSSDIHELKIRIEHLEKKYFEGL